MRCAVLGDPIAHSLSPVLHRAAYAAMGLDWSYEAIRVPSGTLAAFLDGLGGLDGAEGGWRGLSLTMPLKREVLALLDDVDERARVTGAVNTVLLDGGRRSGSNTDVTGARACLGAYDATPERAVVLGGGATATSVLVALAETGLREAVLLVRDPARAAETVAAVQAHPSAPSVRVAALDAATLAEAVRSGEGAGVLVSTVPAAAQTPDLVAAAASAPLVFDVVYDPWPTPLAAAAERLGRGLISGLDLLVAQAVDQVTAMTGRDGVPVPAMRAAAERELAARARG